MLKSLSLFVSIINPVKKNGYGPQGWSLFLQCALSLQGYYLFPGKHQAYKTYYLYFESTPSLQNLPRPSRSYGLPDRLVATEIELLELSLQE